MVAVVAGVGTIVTLYALVRFINAWRRQQGRDAMMGWLTVMIATAAVVLIADRAF